MTRIVWLGRRWAVKIPRPSTHSGIRGWLANQSEWRRRGEPEVNPPRFTLLHLLVWYRRAEFVPFDDRTIGPWSTRAGDESKPNNWGRFGSEWRLLDFDQCWNEQDAGVVARIYWWNRHRIERAWIALAEAEAALA